MSEIILRNYVSTRITDKLFLRKKGVGLSITANVTYNPQELKLQKFLKGGESFKNRQRDESIFPHVEGIRPRISAIELESYRVKKESVFWTSIITSDVLLKVSSSKFFKQYLLYKYLLKIEILKQLKSTEKNIMKQGELRILFLALLINSFKNVIRK